MSFELEYELVTSAERLQSLANLVDSCKSVNEVIALDLETEGYDPYRGRIRILSLNIRNKVYVIDLFQTQTIRPMDEALRKFRGITLGQNLKFDQKWLWHHHRVKFHKCFDTFRASNLIYNGKADRVPKVLSKKQKAAYVQAGERFPEVLRPYKHDLYSIYWRELELKPIAPDLGDSNWGGPLTKEHYDYAAEDVTLLPILRERMIPKLIALGLKRIAQIEFNVIYPEARMELNGMPVNKEKWLRLAAKNLEAERKARVELLAMLPYPLPQLSLLNPDELEAPLLSVNLTEYDEECEDNYIEWLTKARPKANQNKLFNVESPAQILKSLQMLGLKDENGLPISETNELVLAAYLKTVPEVKKLLDHRDLATRIKMFGAQFLKSVHPFTGRLHGDFFPFTGTGRYAMRAPNLNQIPRLRAYRECFEAPEGKRLVICDYDQIEMKIMAQLSGDKELIDAYKKNLDIHRKTASAITGKAMADVTDDERQQGKPANFGFIYGLKEHMFVLYARALYGVELTLAQATTTRRRWFDLYDGVRCWHNKVLPEGQARGYTRSLGGRIRYLSPEAHNEYLNTPDQATGADGLKAAMALVQDRFDAQMGDSAELDLVVHDEFVVLCDEDPEVQNLTKSIVSESMEEAMSEFVTVVAPTAGAKVVKSWAEKK